ncbi:MAG: secretin and TonB N-terminal domain-containing protein [Chitinophagaceae bacterium]
MLSEKIKYIENQKKSNKPFFIAYLVISIFRLAGMRTEGLRGNASVDEGFALLLRGSGLRAVRSAGGYVLAAEPAAAAPAARRTPLHRSPP